jgi:hypothetical protein
MNRLRKFVEQGAYREKPGRTAYAFGPGNLPERAKAWSGITPVSPRRRADGEREPKRGFSSSPRERLRRRHDIGLKVKK